MAAILLPFETGAAIDWSALARLVERTAASGLRPAVNMDTGYGQLLDEAERNRVLDLAEKCASDGFVGGVHVVDAPGDGFDADAYARGIEAVQARGGLPILFPCHGLSSLTSEEWVEVHRGLARHAPRFLAFELGPMFVPYGRIYPLEAYRGLLEIPQCVGAKHSSLSRELEWERLALRDAVRPDFLVLTGNDLAIDMVMYGSDYLLGLASFAPDLFAKRDGLWEAGDPDFYELNDRLQALGSFAFREPVPAYKHAAAMFLQLRGWIASDRTHPGSPQRPAADREVLEGIARRLGILPG